MTVCDQCGGNKDVKRLDIAWASQAEREYDVCDQCHRTLLDLLYYFFQGSSTIVVSRDGNVVLEVEP